MVFLTVSSFYLLSSAVSLHNSPWPWASSLVIPSVMPFCLTLPNISKEMFFFSFLQLGLVDGDPWTSLLPFHPDFLWALMFVDFSSKHPKSCLSNAFRFWIRLAYFYRIILNCCVCLLTERELRNFLRAVCLERGHRATMYCT